MVYGAGEKKEKGRRQNKEEEIGCVRVCRENCGGERHCKVKGLSKNILLRIVFMFLLSRKRRTPPGIMGEVNACLTHSPHKLQMGRYVCCKTHTHTHKHTYIGADTHKHKKENNSMLSGEMLFCSVGNFNTNARSG